MSDEDNTICCVPNCNVDESPDNMTYHQFPKKPEQHKKWLVRLGLLHPEEEYDPDYWASNSGLVCSRHFNKKDYYVNSRRLRGGILPIPVEHSFVARVATKRSGDDSPCTSQDYEKRKCSQNNTPSNPDVHTVFIKSENNDELLTEIKQEPGIPPVTSKSDPLGADQAALHCEVTIKPEPVDIPMVAVNTIRIAPKVKKPKRDAWTQVNFVVVKKEMGCQADLDEELDTESEKVFIKEEPQNDFEPEVQVKEEPQDSLNS